MSDRSVSVIIPCYRCLVTIERALLSVVNQTYLPREIILIDDASNDGTLDKLIEIKRQYDPDRIKVLSIERNSGPAVARNVGWAKASSELIAFLDADDTWSQKKLAIQSDWMMNHPEVVLTGHRCLTRNSILSDYSDSKRREARQVFPYQLLLANRFTTSTVMLRRAISNRFKETKRTSEDYLLWLQIVTDGHLAFLLDIPLAFQYKKKYGAGGISADLWKMESGELNTYRSLKREKRITNLHLVFFSAYSLAKYLKRILVTKLRRILS